MLHLSLNPDYLLFTKQKGVKCPKCTWAIVFRPCAIDNLNRALCFLECTTKPGVDFLLPYLLYFNSTSSALHLATYLVRKLDWGDHMVMWCCKSILPGFRLWIYGRTHSGWSEQCPVGNCCQLWAWLRCDKWQEKLIFIWEQQWNLLEVSLDAANSSLFRTG